MPIGVALIFIGCFLFICSLCFLFSVCFFLIISIERAHFSSLAVRSVGAM